MKASDFDWNCRVCGEAVGDGYVECEFCHRMACAEHDDYVFVVVDGVKELACLDCQARMASALVA